MLVTGIVIPVLTLVVIFLFGVQKFSKQINQAAGEGFKRLLGQVTATPLRGVALGALFTAAIQSSTATTIILIALVDKSVLSFASSLGVILGANIGTTITSQLVAFHVTNIAPYFVLIGFLVTYFGRSYKHLGKPIFYFGLIFFSLSLIALYIEPVKEAPELLALFSNITSIYSAIAVGLIFTAIIQSSSVTSGLVVLLVGAGLLNLEQAIGVMFGANIGTTATALLASFPLSYKARRVATAHFLFNVLGVLCFLPFVGAFIALVRSLGGTTTQVVANAHVIFNLISAGVFLLVLRPFETLVTKVVPAREVE
ncbi:MAG: Na/Pi symporter [Candidatus Paceibacterota bacterium]